MSDSDNVIDFIVILVNATQEPVQQMTKIQGKQPPVIPRSYLECLVLPDWRDWVMAVNKEMSGWRDNQAYVEVNVADLEGDEKIYELGELYSYKRSGKAKHRCIVYGNRLTKMVDYFYTISYTLSHDGLRVFAALSASLRLPIHGADAFCGYLQSKPLEAKPIYVHKPSHANYYDMSMEQLAELRKSLLKIYKQDGMKGIKKVYRKQKKDEEFKKAWAIVKAVYGIPGSGLAFQNTVEKAMEADCMMTQSKVIPAIWFRNDMYTAEQCKKDNVPAEYEGTIARDYIILTISTDDFRYIGTQRATSRFKKQLMKAMHCKELDDVETSDYLSIQFTQDLEKGTTEINQPKYWQDARERFKEYLNEKPKEWDTPMAEGIKVNPATEEEIMEASHLPYRQLIGVIQYAVTCTKPECKYVVSIMSQHLRGWSKEHFALALRILEYCYATREQGIIYSSKDPHGVNLLYAYGDSNFEPPLSRGARYTMMNGAMVSGTSAKHKKTNTSTAEAEAEEAFHASTDVVALRELMKEIGIPQPAPTVIYCDNKPAIQIMENKGALGKRSKAMDTQLYALSDRIVDQEVQLKHCPTEEMVADVGTKALSKSKFAYFRDLVTGYAVAKLE